MNASDHPVSRVTGSDLTPHREWTPLISQIATGDSTALSELHAQAERFVTTIVARVVRNEAETEEVVNDVFQQVWKLAKHYDPVRCNAHSWIAMMARSRALDRWRTVASRTRLVEIQEHLPEHPTAPASSPENLAVDRERRRSIRSSLEQLPAEQREAIQLAFFEGLSHADVAEKSGLPLGTVKTRIRLGLLKLREQLPQHGAIAEGAAN
jgi:RNA polymerase sigma-70 factor, ECF subfamily